MLVTTTPWFVRYELLTVYTSGWDMHRDIESRHWLINMNTSWLKISARVCIHLHSGWWSYVVC